MSEYVVEPKYRWQLRQLANVLRDKLGLHDTLFFPIVELLDLMCELFEGFSYEIVPDSEFPPNIHGDTNILKQHIRIKESVYNGAANGVGRAISWHTGNPLYRSAKRDKDSLFIDTI